MSKNVNDTKYVLVAPVNGKCVDLKSVPDKMFAEKIMGEGVAFIYKDDMIYSPCNGIIGVISNTKHAIGIVSDDILEVLIHVGVDTVKLKGKGFEVLVEKGQRVKVGTPLLKIDRKFMEDNDINLITPMVITNCKQFHLDFNCIGKDVEKGKTCIAEFVN